MSIRTHVETLKRKHAEVEQDIHNAYRYHEPIGGLKKYRLHLKDQINRFLNTPDAS